MAGEHYSRVITVTLIQLRFLRKPITSWKKSSFERNLRIFISINVHSFGARSSTLRNSITPGAKQNFFRNLFMNFSRFTSTICFPHSMTFSHYSCRCLSLPLPPSKVNNLEKITLLWVSIIRDLLTMQVWRKLTFGTLIGSISENPFITVCGSLRSLHAKSYWPRLANQLSSLSFTYISLTRSHFSGQVVSNFFSHLTFCRRSVLQIRNHRKNFHFCENRKNYYLTGKARDWKH